MKILLDTNIIIDIISKRSGYEDSLQVFKYCELGWVRAFISATTVTDIMYILRKQIEPHDVRAAMETLFLIVDIASVTKDDIMHALSSNLKDFEDAVQVACAKRNGANYIITRNIKDFNHADVMALDPRDAIELIRDEFLMTKYGGKFDVTTKNS